jgi:hypothetical protein
MPGGRLQGVERISAKAVAGPSEVKSGQPGGADDDLGAFGREPWTRRSRAATGAGVRALERSIRMGFTHPAAILAGCRAAVARYRTIRSRQPTTQPNINSLAACWAATCDS